MHIKPVLIPISFLSAILILSCNKEFSPKGPFQDQFVIYSVLSNDRDLQFVRVYFNYDAPGYDPFVNTADKPIEGAQVTVSGAGETHVFKDTLLPRADTSRYKTPIHAYVSNWRAGQGELYDLHVSTRTSGSSARGITVPSRPPKLEIYGVSILDDPGDLKFPGSVGLGAQLNTSTMGLAGKMMIEYTVQISTGWKTEEREVTRIDYNLDPLVSRNQNNYYFFGRTKAAYVAALNDVIHKYPGQRIIFKRIIFRLLQFEQNMYEYYNIVHGFQDPFTIRFDEPDYTNMSSGYGVFGAYSLDSLVHICPDDFSFNR